MLWIVLAFLFASIISVFIFLKKESKKKNTVNSVLNDSEKLKSLKEVIENSEKEEVAIKRIRSILNVSTDVSIDIYEKIINKNDK
ncbi:hypothetical protein [Vagococcus fluvialis]|uniref:hypothetical protein n=1 Tax=Vagococcus fluvialis TaxID=2738 RepID=UPI0037BBAC43